MKRLHFDIISGIAGDMSVAALVHLGAPIEPMRCALASMGLCEVELAISTVRPHGITSLRFSVSFNPENEDHRSWKTIRELLDRAEMPAGAKTRAHSIFQRLAAAEALVHGTSEDDVVFHEVGAVDSIADVVGCALALEHLAPEVITSSPPLLGRGVTSSHHGTIPVPAPATLELLRGIPTQGLDVQAELTTPTGAAILASQVDEFISWPAMTITGIGYGAGTREVQGRHNALRAVLGESAAEAADGDEYLVEANIDDMSPEHFEHLMDQLLAAGAHDVWLQPVIMKKSRPAITLAFLCHEKKRDELELILFRESTTIGIRRHPVSRRKLARRIQAVDTPFGQVRIKVSGEADEIWTASPEYDDCRACAGRHGVPLKTVFQAAIVAWKATQRPGPSE